MLTKRRSMQRGRRAQMKAWLVTWEWLGDHAKRDEVLAGVFNPRWGAERVRELVEFIYAQEYSLGERANLARGRANPYPAEFGTLGGKPWSGEIYCGHNPFLRARLVDSLSIERVDGKEKATWQERPKPNTPFSAPAAACAVPLSTPAR